MAFNDIERKRIEKVVGANGRGCALFPPLACLISSPLDLRKEQR